MKVTATKCLNGKRHYWKVLLVTPMLPYDPVSYEQRWCPKCGCSA